MLLRLAARVREALTKVREMGDSDGRDTGKDRFEKPAMRSELLDALDAKATGRGPERSHLEANGLPTGRAS